MALGGVVVAVVVTVGVFVSVVLARVLILSVPAVFVVITVFVMAVFQVVNGGSEVLGCVLIEIVALLEIARNGLVMAFVVLLEDVDRGSVGGESFVVTIVTVAVVAVINVLVRLHSFVMHGYLIGSVLGLCVAKDWLVVNSALVMHCGVVMVCWLVMRVNVVVITMLGTMNDFVRRVVFISVVAKFVRSLLVVEISIVMSGLVVSSFMVGLVVGTSGIVLTMFISMLGGGDGNDCSKCE